ncbi:heparinase II/III family protein [Desulfoferrobacter suflitae]|uniref:heparinase II/III family protein n=1 Tax=Desulfoferrobacter suflitae TaxID=2865782 RepID=UPI00216489FC|nr:heparinase II/III family protein [Desulfoferrobacter suflitae]MCK8603926.1 heparinase II/III family protein [Desulfoferrobacter suflitae]
MSRIQAISLLFRTLEHLRPVQVLYRVRYAIRSRLRQSLPDGALRRHRFAKKVGWRRLEFRTAFLSCPSFASSDIERGIFRFLNNPHYFDTGIDWQVDAKSRLWRYNLHYFQYLFPPGGLAPRVAVPLMQHWVAHNPVGAPDAWDPFPISLRLVNWIKYFSVTPMEEAELQPLVRSAYEQAGYLARSLEYHLLGNHLFKNGKALIFAGLFLRGEDAARWLAKGMQIVSKELAEQILPDGGHFERSPMYHSMILEDCLDLLNVCRGENRAECRELVDRLEEVVPRMSAFLAGMTHPDGEIALFNDAAFGIEASPQALGDYLQKITAKAPRCQEKNIKNLASWRLGGEKKCSFPETGYFVMSPNPGDRLIIDCGPIGPDYQPGHSHCDTLSFELSLQNRRVIVDSGCCQYEDSEIRRYNRGNAGHNTISIDNQNQSEVWGAHRCARRARALYAGLEQGDGGELVFAGAHDGYRRLKGSPVHHRRMVWAGSELRVEDRVEGIGVHEIESRLHIHPALSVKVDGDGAVVRDNAGILARLVPLCFERPEVSEGWYCPEFGRKEACVVVRVRARGVKLPWSGGWVFRCP